MRPPPSSMGLAVLAALAAALAGAPLQAAELSWSGFGTLGYARSDRDYTYERFVDRDGTFKRDSLLGVQASADLTPRWSATAQATLAPSSSDDQRWQPTLQWAFLSYRAGNDVLLRAGKLRMPMYLYSENMNVGASYDVLHLPTEVYSTAPTNDYTGASFSKTWSLAAGDLSLDGYSGRTNVTARRQLGSSSAPAGLHTRSTGLVLSLRRDDDSWRMGLQRAKISVDGNNGAEPGLAAGATIPAGATGTSGDIAPGVPAGAGMAAIDTRVFLLGADVGLGGGWRAVGEYARRHAVNAVTPKNSQGAYLTLLRKSGHWTAYATLARLLTDAEARRAAGGHDGIDDQTASTLGAAYALTPSSKLKAEWMHVHIGAGSSLIDRASGVATVRRQGMNLLSLSYSVAF